MADKLEIGVKVQLFFPASDIHGWKGMIIDQFESGKDIFYEVKIEKESIVDLDKYLELCKINNLTPFRIRAKSTNIKVLFPEKKEEKEKKKEHLPNITKGKDVDGEKGEVLEQF